MTRSELVERIAAKMPNLTIKDIAKIAGVSATTVSNVIHGRTEKVSRKTRKRIEEILENLPE